MRKVRKFKIIWCLLLLTLLTSQCTITPRTQEITTRPTATVKPTMAATATADLPPTATVKPTTTATATADLPPTATVKPTTAATAAADLTPAPTTAQLTFATYHEPVVHTAASLPSGNISPGLENVINPFTLSASQLAGLAEDGFVVNPGDEKEFFTLYRKVRNSNVPIFVTSDSLLHVYHLLFDKVLRSAETTSFIPQLLDLNNALLAQTDANYQALQGTDWEEAARRVVAFVSVSGQLLDPEFAVPTYAQELVEAEIANIEASDGIQASPIFPDLPYGEDYTQYIPRGHYTLSEEFKAYFKSMMWYGRMTFRLETDEPDAGRAETRMALILVHALRNAEANGQAALNLWIDLYNPTVFFVGRSDDLTVLQYAEVMDQIYGNDASITTLADETQLDSFIALAKQLPAPKILGLVIADTQEVEKNTKGLRLMGQRFVPDAYIFRELMYRNVGTREQRRGLPMGLDVFAAMGSERAYQILDELGETDYANYPEQMSKMRVWLTSLEVNDWTETLYNTWLYTFYPLLKTPSEGYPEFMQSTAWQDKQLNTTLGSWAELKHDTILYAKQAYSGMGSGPEPPAPVPPKGYVEPVPLFYARLSALTSMTREGLQSRGMLTEEDAQSLQNLLELSLAFQTMAEKELRGEALTEEEYARIRFYGEELEHLTMAAADTEQGEPKMITYMEEDPQAAVIADVATDPDPDADNHPNPVVLEVAVGPIHELHAIVPIVEEDGSITLQIAKGGVFSYYEFTWPADDRLTDEKWRQMIAEGSTPDLPAWIQSYFVEEASHSQSQIGVLDFQKSVTYAFWIEQKEFTEQEGALAQFGSEIQELHMEKRYLGHQLIRTHFRSFDLQSPTRAVVTVRETWQDSLHTYTSEYPHYNEPAIETRGPYTLDVTYTLESKTLEYGELWYVTQAIYANEPPAW